MKLLSKFIFGIALMGLAISCGNNSESNPEDAEASNDHAEKTEATHSDEASHDKATTANAGDIGVSLDDGKRWEANAETTEGINNMIKLMKGFSDSESIVAYAKLNKDLQNEFGLIFQRCTMKGESHNQLHNYLVPMKDMFKGLTASDIKICKKSYADMGKQLAQYEKYFV